MGRRNSRGAPGGTPPRRDNAGWFTLFASGVVMIFLMPRFANVADALYDTFLAQTYGDAEFIALIVFLLLMGLGFFATAMFLSFLGRLIVHKVSGWMA